MQFGTKRVTKVIDKETGSTKSVEVNYRNFEPVSPFRVHYAIRKRVEEGDGDTTLRDEFFAKCEQHKDRLDPQYTREHTITGNRDGFYYGVMSYTELRDPNMHKDLLDLIFKV